MSLEQINEIDTIGIDNATGVVVLSIIDGLDWQDEQNHLEVLQEKINNYLSFIESGDIYNAYPDAKERAIEIKIFAKYDFTEKAFQFLINAEKIIANAGFKLRWIVRG